MKLQDINLHEVGVTIQLAGAVYTDGKGGYLLLPLPGEGENITAMQPNDHLDPRYDILAMDLPEWNTFLRQTDLVEVEALVKEEDGKLGKALVRKTARQISQIVSWKVYRRDFTRCRYCGSDDDPLTVDHLVLWEEGGPSTEDNLVAACKKCNQARGNTEYGAWLKSNYYRRVSQNLPPAVQEANERLVPTLPRIARHPLKGKRQR